MKSKKLLFVILLFLGLITIVSCSQANAFEHHWNNYVKAVNAKDLDTIADLTFSNRSQKTSFLEVYRDNDDHLDYFDNIGSIKTIEFNIDVFCDLSTDSKSEMYVSADVKLEIENQSQKSEVEFKIYGNNDGGIWYFCNQPVLLSGEILGNQPNDNWNTKTYFTSEEGLVYKVVGEDKNKTISIYDYDSSAKEVTIPETIEGFPVTTIAKYSFYEKSDFLNITLATSKLNTINFSKNVTTIEDYAFYQAKSLKELIIPANITTISKYSFASCRGLKKIEFLVDDSQHYSKLSPVTSVVGPNSEYNIEIKNGRDMYIGDIIALEGNVLDSVSDSSLRWTSSSPTVATVDGRGYVTALTAGTVTITATLIAGENTFNCATVTMKVSSIPSSVTFDSTTFDRCSGLKEFVVHTINPLSITITGTGMKLSSDAKIYVPKGSRDMYRAAWSTYAEQIFEME